MREFTATLQNIMSVVPTQPEPLPASEGAVEEMTYVDEEERDNTRLSGDHSLVENSLEILKSLPSSEFPMQRGRESRNRPKKPRSTSSSETWLRWTLSAETATKIRICENVAVAKTVI